MRIPTRRRRYGLRFDLTAMNDIVFLLIIFLVASPHFTSSETKEEIDLARVPAEESESSENERRLEVSIRRNGEFRIGNQTVSKAEIQKRINTAGKAGGDFEMRLRVDRKTKFSTIEPILIECAKSNIRDVKFAVLPE